MIKTKTIATIGPATCGEPQLQALVNAGVDIVRLNFSHGTLAEHQQVLERVRRLAAASGHNVAVMGDLAGPKVRIGQVAPHSGPILKGSRLTISKQEVLGDNCRISTTLPALIDDVEVGHRVLIDDGRIHLIVDEKRPGEIVCLCQHGGVLSDHKGINLPDTALSIAALTAKDLRDLQWAIEHEVDFLALSFVRAAGDMLDLRARLRSAGAEIHIVAKLEKPQAIAAIDDIIAASDALLVARGDLGVEMDLARVPCLQKDITFRCQRAGKPVIIATQMLQSMVDSPGPTRAEVSDVANAIFDAADAVMLSGETAVGRYPVEAVDTMQRICEETERHSAALPWLRAESTWIEHKDLRSTASLAESARRMADRLEPVLLAVWTHSGASARLLSKYRFQQPIVALTESPRTMRQLALNYGVIAIQTPCPRDSADLLRLLDDLLLAQEWVCRGDLVLVIAGTEFGRSGGNNALLIHHVGATQSPPGQVAATESNTRQAPQTSSPQAPGAALGPTGAAGA